MRIPKHNSFQKTFSLIAKIIMPAMCITIPAVTMSDVSKVTVDILGESKIDLFSGQNREITYQYKTSLKLNNLVWSIDADDGLKDKVNIDSQTGILSIKCDEPVTGEVNIKINHKDVSKKVLINIQEISIEGKNDVSLFQGLSKKCIWTSNVEEEATWSLINAPVGVSITNQYSQKVEIEAASSLAVGKYNFDLRLTPKRLPDFFKSIKILFDVTDEFEITSDVEEIDTWTKISTTCQMSISVEYPVIWSLESSPTDYAIDNNGLITVGPNAISTNLVVKAQIDKTTHIRKKTIPVNVKTLKIINVPTEKVVAYQGFAKKINFDEQNKEPCRWTIVSDPSSKFTINQNTGELSTTSNLMVGSYAVKIKATAIFNNAVWDEATVNFDCVNPTILLKSGNTSIVAWCYNTVSDQAILSDVKEEIQWDIKTPVSGVSINSTTGNLSFSGYSTVETKKFTVVANLKDDKNVRWEKEYTLNIKLFNFTDSNTDSIFLVNDGIKKIQLTTSQPATFSLVSPPTGWTISNTGELSIPNVTSVSTKTVTIRATCKENTSISVEKVLNYQFADFTFTIPEKIENKKYFYNYWIVSINTTYTEAANDAWSFPSDSQLTSHGISFEQIDKRRAKIICNGNSNVWNYNVKVGFSLRGQTVKNCENIPISFVNATADTTANINYKYDNTLGGYGVKADSRSITSAIVPDYWDDGTNGYKKVNHFLESDSTRAWSGFSGSNLLTSFKIGKNISENWYIDGGNTSYFSGTWFLELFSIPSGVKAFSDMLYSARCRFNAYGKYTTIPTGYESFFNKWFWIAGFFSTQPTGDFVLDYDTYGINGLSYSQTSYLEEMTNITFGSQTQGCNLKYITSNAWSRVYSNLEKLTCYATTPPVVLGVDTVNFLKNVSKPAFKVYVPAGRSGVYKAAAGWKNVADKIFEI